VSRPARDRDTERRAIQSAAQRLLAGTPLRPAAGTLSASELITESGLPRWKVYEHRDLVEQFQAAVKAQDAVPAAVQDIKRQNESLQAKIGILHAELEAERSRTAVLRRVITEQSLELAQIRQEDGAGSQVTRLPRPRRPLRNGAFGPQPS
jgi:predicted RNase H-like nuclease (RuvC/YqgF family)